MNHWKRSFTLACLCAVLTDEQGHVVYERGRVRPGDKTKNAPEIIPQGQRASYTYEGFTVSFILPANGQPQPAD